MTRTSGREWTSYTANGKQKNTLRLFGDVAFPVLRFKRSDC